MAGVAIMLNINQWKLNICQRKSAANGW
jgi:hypothetical protein